METKWMKEALELAKTALDRQEVPVGCIIVHKKINSNGEYVEEILSRGFNRVNELKNATMHAGKILANHQTVY
jgi:tRNA(Arg) A34 adenosine deaminase TadA